MFSLLLLLYLQKLLECDGSTVITSAAHVIACRTERQVHLPLKQYRLDVCARCYKYMPPVSFREKLQYVRDSGCLFDPRTNTSFFVDDFNVSDAVLDSFADESFAEKWKGCCRAAWDCCHDMARRPPSQGPDSEKFCPRTWDGWQCWPDTPAGTTASQPCQDHIYFENHPPSCSKFAHKECLSNGTWFRNEFLREWTNYSTCGRQDEHQKFLDFHIATYMISIIFILPAVVIFMAYKQLQVPRITMHKNLFLSLLLNGVCAVLFKSLVVADELKRTHNYSSVMDRNGAGCKFLFVLTRYFRMTNYMWMFCEGFYLQKLIAATFAEQRNLVMFYIIGWVLPLIPVGTYSILRAVLNDESCWAFPVEIFEWILNMPNLLSLLINLFFLCNIIRILITKLRATHAKEPSQYRKAVRATLVLVPLFGLHFCLVIYKPLTGKCGIFQAYIYFSYAMDGLQGFMVTVIFCYLNNEVLYLLKRTYQRYKLNSQFRSRKNSAVTTLTTLNDSQNHHHRFHKAAKDAASHGHRQTASDFRRTADRLDHNKAERQAVSELPKCVEGTGLCPTRELIKLGTPDILS